MDKKDRVSIIDVPISAVNLDTCLKSIFEDFDSVRGKYICVSNVHTTVMAHDDPSYYAIQAESLMSVPDGKPLSIIGRISCPEMDRVTGPDLMRAIFEKSRENHCRHYFYGNTKGNLDLLINSLKEKYPWLEIAGYEPSVFRELLPQEEIELIARINSTRPDFVWIALGAPKQERLCYKLKGKISGLMIGVGGAFNILAGIIPEAPKWMQDTSLEWAYRLMQEPKRLFRRYAITNSKFIWYIISRKKRKNDR